MGDSPFQNNRGQTSPFNWKRGRPNTFTQHAITRPNLFNQLDVSGASPAPSVSAYTLPPESIGASIAPTIQRATAEQFPVLKPQFQDIYLEPFQPVANSPQQALNDALRRREAMGREAVSNRFQEQIDRGERGFHPLKDQGAASAAIIERMNSNQISNVRPGFGDAPVSTKVVPGIGHVTQYQANGYAENPADRGANTSRVMTGRYGTGTATFGPPTERTITENGQAVPIAGWFKDAARRQGESNQFFNKEGRKIV